MNNNSSSENEQNIIDKLDRLIDTVDYQTRTIENQTAVINKLRSEILEKDAGLAGKDIIINKPAPKSLRKPSIKIAIQGMHDILKATFGIPISTGAINNMIASMTEKLTPVLVLSRH